MDASLAYFAAVDGGFAPLPAAISNWSSDMVTGPAVCGVLARALEVAHVAEGFVPARLTVDLFRPVRPRPLVTTTSMTRRSHRLRIVDAELVQDGTTVARASLVSLRRSAQPPGEVWTRDRRPQPPPTTVASASDLRKGPWFGSDDHPQGWSRSRSEHQNASRKRIWTHQIPVVSGEAPSPFVRTAMLGETTSLITNWGTAGVGFINCDLTLVLARLPEGPELGLEADNHLSAEGVAVGTATLYDRSGAFGTSVVSALANSHRQVNFTDELP